jgi:hypothetical protein
LEFSALLRQPRHIPKQEKLDYVDEVLKLLEMEAYQHAVVGDLGEGGSECLALRQQRVLVLKSFLQSVHRS